VKQHVRHTSVLLHHWHRPVTTPLDRSTIQDPRDWARELVEIEESHAIVTPVALEVICGARTNHELRLSQAFLEGFRLIDGGKVTEGDWDQARRLARRIPRDGRPRQLGDCLIPAIAKRLRFRVRTLDTGMPR
jgi:predicted nucleic acid-binding protein